MQANSAARIEKRNSQPNRFKGFINIQIEFKWTGDKVLHVVILLAGITSAASFVYFYQEDMILAYGDAIARLTMSRLATNSVNPGIEQLIGVWPPLPQAVMVLLSIIDPLYETGLSGSLVIMTSFVVGAAYMYKLVLSFTNDKLASFIGGFVAFSTADMLFLQSTPMSEVPFTTFIVMTTYFTRQWMLQEDLGKLKPLCLAAATLAAACMTRYEGWVGFIPFLSVIAITHWQRKISYKKTEDHLFVFATIVGGPILAWLILNLQYLGDPLFFMNSEFSSGSIARAALAGMNESNRSIHNLPLSIELYARSAFDTVGWITASLGIVGVTLLFFSKQNVAEKLLTLCLLYPFVFFIASLYFGWSALWHPDVIEGSNWGTRYGVLMTPAAALGVGYLVHKVRFIQFPVFVLVILSTGITWQGGILSAGEALQNKTNDDARIHAEITSFLDEHYDRGIVVMNRFGNEPIFYKSPVPLNKITYEGVEQDFWNQALTNPISAHVDWIIMRGHPDGRRQDEIWRTLRGSPTLVEHYDLVAQGYGYEIYKIKGTDLPAISETHPINPT